MYKETLRQVWAEIDMSAFDHNVKEIKRQMECPEMIGVIKANGYGHGATECAKVLAHNGVSKFAVATLEEALNLREDGIEGDIVILGLTPAECVDTVIEYDLTPVVMHYDYVKALSDEAVKEGAEPAKCLFGLDTGMGRIGLEPTPESVEIVKKIASLPSIEMEGIFTHFARADEEMRFSNPIL
jgi:alanine racemase